MRRLKFGYIGLLAVLLMFTAAWGYEKATGQIPITGPSETLTPLSPSGTPASALQTQPSPSGTPAPTLQTQPAASGLTPSSPTLSPAATTPLPQAVPTVPPVILSGGETLLAVGDIATCSRENDEAVAEIVKNNPGTAILLGDIVYERGTQKNFTDCFDPAWGPLKSRLKPSVGNHEYYDINASGYFDYFGAAAGDSPQGYYSFDVGTWHIIALNSNCQEVPGGCRAGSPQETWLRKDLADHPSHCTLAFWHHALFSSGDHGNHPEMKPMWDALYAAGAELVLNGHDHDYERFAPQTPDGRADPATGIREFIVGTGGKGLREVGKLIPNSEIDDASSFGLLKLTLAPDGYAWEFVPTAGGTFTDAGQGTCH